MSIPAPKKMSDNADRETPASVAEYRTVRKRVATLKPSPENERIYRPVYDDPDINRLMESIRTNGLFVPLIITKDNFVVSGHRRLSALKRLKKVWVPCQVLPVRRDSMTADEFVTLLREHNRQRHKSVAEQVREELIRSPGASRIGSSCWISISRLQRSSPPGAVWWSPSRPALRNGCAWS
jgi:ParB-like nuclease domain